MKPSCTKAQYWDSLIKKIDRSPLDKDVALYYRNEHLRLIADWAGSLAGKHILKTDLYEEALGGEPLLFSLREGSAGTFGMDISFNAVARAREHSGGSGASFERGVVADVRNCAFRDESFDLIVSNSTLDHLDEKEMPGVLQELRRVLKKGGALVLTLDNGHNPLHVFTFFVRRIFTPDRLFLGSCYRLGKIKKWAKACGFSVEDTDAIVHIFPPFTRMVRFFNETQNPFLKKLAALCLKVASRLGGKKTKFLTGWFIALKLVKNAG